MNALKALVKEFIKGNLIFKIQMVIFVNAIIRPLIDKNLLRLVL